MKTHSIINEKIEAQRILLVDESGENRGEMSLQQGLEYAREKELDLVQMAEAAEGKPAVCKVMDYGKHVFGKKKGRAETRRHQHRQQIKEIKFRVGTEEADYKVKLKKLTAFLENRDKCKVTLRFRGREMMHRELGERVLEQVADDLKDIGVVEQAPEIEQNQQLSMLIVPKRKGRGGRSNKTETGDDSASVSG